MTLFFRWSWACWDFRRHRINHAHIFELDSRSNLDTPYDVHSRLSTAAVLRGALSSRSCTKIGSATEGGRA